MSSPILWLDSERETAFMKWLDEIAAQHALVSASARLASADASFRRYFRIDSQAGESRIIMDAPPDKEDSASFVKIARLMAEAGLRVPQVLAWDSALGFMLLNDLGSQTMLEVMDTRNAQANHARYMQALDALVALQLASKPNVLPPYDETLLRRELSLFPDWYLLQHKGLALDAALMQPLQAQFDLIVKRNLAAEKVYVHRDFMPRNLMVAGEQLGVLDFQDAVYGPITYDIASLMRDAFLSWEEDFVLDVTVRYWEKARSAGLPVGDDFGEFYRNVEWMGLQRHLKVLGIFARITLRDGKPKYLADTPRFINYVRHTTSRYRELAPLLRLIDRVAEIQTSVGYAIGRT